MINQIGTINSYDNSWKPEGVSGKEKGYVKQDRVSFSYTEYTYSSYTVEGRLTDSESTGYDHLKNYVNTMLEKQGLTIRDVLEGKPYSVDEETEQNAAQLVAAEGYWGVEQTSERIFQFAVNASGNDTEKLEKIKAAVDKGFNMAVEAFGGSLPEISYQTYDAVMEKLDEWAGESEADAPPAN